MPIANTYPTRVQLQAKGRDLAAWTLCSLMPRSDPMTKSAELACNPRYLHSVNTQMGAPACGARIQKHYGVPQHVPAPCSRHMWSYMAYHRRCNIQEHADEVLRLPTGAAFLDTQALDAFVKRLHSR